MEGQIPRSTDASPQLDVVGDWVPGFAETPFGGNPFLHHQGPLAALGPLGQGPPPQAARPQAPFVPAVLAPHGLGAVAVEGSVEIEDGPWLTMLGALNMVRLAPGVYLEVGTHDDQGTVDGTAMHRIRTASGHDASGASIKADSVGASSAFQSHHLAAMLHPAAGIFALGHAIMQLGMRNSTSFPRRIAQGQQRLQHY